MLLMSAVDALPEWAKRQYGALHCYELVYKYSPRHHAPLLTLGFSYNLEETSLAVCLSWRQSHFKYETYGTSKDWLLAHL